MKERNKKARVARIASALIASTIAIPLATAIPGIVGNKAVRAGGDWAKVRENTSLGTHKIASPVVNTDPNEDWKGSYVWYGRLNDEQILFRVLDPETTDYGGKTMFLDSDRILYHDYFVNSAPIKAWSDSDLRADLNDGFLTTAFTEQEQAAIFESKRTVAPSYSSGTWELKTYQSFVSLTGEKLFVLDGWEVLNPEYGYSSDSGWTKGSSGYYTLHDVGNRVKMYKGEAQEWWLRSKVSNNPIANIAIGLVRPQGYCDEHAFSKTIGSNTEKGVAPALNLDLDHVLLASAVNGDTGDMDTQYKLTIKDDALSFSVPTGKKIRYDFVAQRQVHVPYQITGDHAEQANRLSVLITDGDPDDPMTNIIFYEPLTIDGAFSKEGEASFYVPYLVDDIGEWGVDYHVYVFPEKIIDSKYETDYAGAFYEIEKKPYSDVVIDLQKGWTKIDQEQKNALGNAAYCGVIKMEVKSGDTYVDIDKDGTADFIIPYDFENERTERTEKCSAQGKVVLSDNILRGGNINSLTFILPEKITAIDIKLAEPLGGQKPSYDAKIPSGVNYYFMPNSGETYKNDITWTDMTALFTMKVDQDTFQIGRKYSVSLNVTAKEGFVFDFPV
ncbi:MAG: hypothetical protein IKD90_02000 [Clostridiales bacterium]|nr:hypothetical protein [Clostridiales bacterium]